MSSKILSLWSAAFFVVLASAAAAGDAPSGAAELPNVVIVFTDDQGYQDVGCFGSPDIKTPNLDRMAKEGRRFTSFYVGAPCCSASRAMLMTGCYPQRVGILAVLMPEAKIGINPNEWTMGEMFKTRGYATAVVGKWHLGSHPKFLPTRHGFDEYLGLPYSNDMWPPNPYRKKPYTPLLLINNDKPIEYISDLNDMSRLTTRYTEFVVDFIERNRDRPFFVYLPHSMPHVPLAVSDKYQGKSPRGLYGDVIEEIDWSVGQILATLKRLNLDEKTLVVFTSDNGPWLTYGRQHGGAALPLREGKGTAFEGGFREPCIMRWPGKIPADTACDEVAATMDLLPTLAKLIGAELPDDRIIDGRDIWPLIGGQPGATSPHEALAYYQGRRLNAVRSGRWKLHFPHDYTTIVVPGKDGRRGKGQRRKIGLALFDLETDIGETTNVADEHPDVVRRLTKLADRFRDDLGDTAQNRQGKNARPPGRVN
ncbi:MAG: sulfatase [Pirellulales bacterium]|nr:sulfatase [Pirellulales bacterium]